MIRRRGVQCVLVALVLLSAAAGEILSGSQAPPPAETPDDEPIDFEQARQLLQKQRRGERLTDDERAFLDRARAARRRMDPQNRPRADRQQQPAQAPRATTGLVPLTELSGDGRYKGQLGGLYGDGRNEPPDEHLQAALAAAREIQPLDAEGRPAADGRIGLISVGMSNTTQEFAAFVRQANSDPAKSPLVVLVDGAQGGRDASDWADPERRLRGERPDVWSVLEQRLERAGATPAQVQVAWIKQARRNPAGLGEFPQHADALQQDLGRIVRELKERFPNLRLAYVSSRIYAGYARGALNPEPYAYEGAFAVRGLIADQVAGRPELNHDPARGEISAPVILWGPYLWGDGETPRKSDGLVWTREDLAADGTHPSDSGRHKVAELLLEFFKTDATAKSWFVRGE